MVLELDALWWEFLSVVTQRMLPSPWAGPRRKAWWLGWQGQGIFISHPLASLLLGYFLSSWSNLGKIPQVALSRSWVGRFSDGELQGRGSNGPSQRAAWWEGPLHMCIRRSCAHAYMCVMHGQARAQVSQHIQKRPLVPSAKQDRYERPQGPEQMLGGAVHSQPMLEPWCKCPGPCFCDLHFAGPRSPQSPSAQTHRWENQAGPQSQGSKWVGLGPHWTGRDISGVPVFSSREQPLGSFWDVVTAPHFPLGHLDAASPACRAWGLQPRLPQRGGCHGGP